MSTAGETSSGALIQPSSLAEIQPITLAVGEKRFVTARGTLTDESEYFAAIFSGRWKVEPQADGSYFVDADPALFEHILRFLRRGVFPTFYDNVKGHDFALYAALLQEAKFFQIARLVEWLQEKSYLNAVKVERNVEEVSGPDLRRETTRGDEDTEFHPVWVTRKVYICPRRIIVHRGNRGACGRQCENAQPDDGPEYEEEKDLQVLLVRKRTVFDHQLCIDGEESVSASLARLGLL